MLRLSMYFIAFMCTSLGANLRADDSVQDQKREDARVEEKREQTVRDDAKVEQDREQNVRNDAQEREEEKVQEKRSDDAREERRREDRKRSDNAQNGKGKLIAQQDEKGPREEKEERAPTIEREQRAPTIEKQQKAPTIEKEQKAPTIEKEQKAPTIEKEQKAPVEKRAENKPAVQPMTKERFNQKNEQLTKQAKMERDRFRDFRNKRHVFDQDYWNNYYARDNHWHFNRNFNWWGVATIPLINNWLQISTGAPRYYYYGDNGVIYYSNSSSFNNFTPVQGYDHFVNQAVVMARHIPQVDPESMQWMPLGVYSVEPDNAGANANPNGYFTLAVAKEGIIGGVYFNPEHNQNREIEGIVDRQSMRAVWKFIGSDWPIFEAGVFNFTQDESTAFVHYPQGRMEPQLLIRLQE